MTPTLGNSTPDFRKIVPGGKTTPPPQSPEVELMAKRGYIMRFQDRLHWDEIAKELGILKENGDSDPGMTYRIVMDGYEPKLLETRKRLGLPEICPECHQKLPKPPRKVLFDLAQMDAVIEFLRERERPAMRVYGRGGKRL
jgi:hypothetical protein